MLSRMIRPLAYSFTIGIILTAGAACSEPFGSEEQPQLSIAAVRLAAEGAAPPVTIIAAGQSGASFVLPAGTSAVAIDAEWLGSGGHPLDERTSAEVELRIAGPLFTVTHGTLGGTISGLVPGSNLVTLFAWDPQQDRARLAVNINVIVASSGCSPDVGCGAWDY